MEHDHNVQWDLRRLLLNFMVEAHLYFRFHNQTLFLAVSLLDKYYSKTKVLKRNYQVAGCVSLWIASKYLERRDIIPNVEMLCTACDHAYDPELFTQMELHMLFILQGSIGKPTAETFLCLFLGSEQIDSKLYHLALLICEVALYEREFITLPTSELSAAAVALAHRLLHKPEVQHASWVGQYDKPILITLLARISKAPISVLRKYSSKRLSGVSMILKPFNFGLSEPTSKLTTLN